MTKIKSWSCTPEPFKFAAIGSATIGVSFSNSGILGYDKIAAANPEPRTYKLSASPRNVDEAIVYSKFSKSGSLVIPGLLYSELTYPITHNAVSISGALSGKFELAKEPSCELYNDLLNYEGSPESHKQEGSRLS